MAALTEKQVTIRVKGTVQGVGFRPYVWHLAQQMALQGQVLNDSEGVLIELSGATHAIEHFIHLLSEQAPPLAQIDDIRSEPLKPQKTFDGFNIIPSQTRAGTTQISVDGATCKPCLSEISDPGNRRYLYPFTNCTNCGPRLTIVTGIPYDRAQTTMSHFPLCRQCLNEYQDPQNRRFHAQPNACHQCGPQLFVAYPQGQQTLTDPIAQTKQCLHQIQQALNGGQIVALKGLGGFHLCVDATCDEAVWRLRQKKHRYAKPLALMAPDIQTIGQYAELSDAESQLLSGVQAPIVLLDKKKPSDVAKLAAQVAPDSNQIGFMLPYTPLHQLILAGFAKPLVMTSGNLSNHVQLTDNQEAIEQLGTIADLIVCHNRDIANRLDDSVVRVMAGEPRLLRRARGFAPKGITLPQGFENAPEVLAFGAELKSTFCLITEQLAVLSQHQGDLEDVSTYDDYEKNLQLYQNIYNHQPRVLVADKHPRYLSTQLAEQYQKNQGVAVSLYKVQHHHAHIAACMAENQRPLNAKKVLGLALDGLGYGADDTLWGGEFLLADYQDFTRLGRLKPIALIGGSKAILEPWRNTFAHILDAMGWQTYQQQYANTELFEFFSQKPTATMVQMLDQGINVPKASSCGRLFDAVAAALNLCRDKAQFEGQGPLMLEALVDPKQLFNKPYQFTIGEDQQELLCLDPAMMWRQLLADLSVQASPSTISSRFHGGFINGVAELALILAQRHQTETIVLSGGCMQNRFLLEGLIDKFRSAGLNPLSHTKVPANDGGLSLGQAVIAAAKSII